MLKPAHTDCRRALVLVLGVLVSLAVSAEERGAPSHLPVSPLGISAEEIPFPELAGMDLQYGVRVTEVVPGRAAARAGLQVGDVIARMGLKAIHDPVDVRRGLDFYEPGETVELEIIRDKVHLTVSVVLAGPPAADEPGFDAERAPVLPLPDPRLWREPLEDLMQELMRQWKELLRELEEAPSGQAQDYL